MAQRKNNRKLKLQIALMIIGVLLLAISIAIHILDKENSYDIIFSIFGASFVSVNFEAVLDSIIKSDDEINALDLFERAVNLIDASMKQSYKPSEKDLKIFRKSPLNLYFLTMSEQGDLFWNYTVFDFSLKKHQYPRRLVTEAIFYNLTKTKELIYGVEIFRNRPTDPIIATFKIKGGQESTALAVLDPCVRRTENVYGFTRHEGWNSKTLISSAILTFEPLFPNENIGPVCRNNSLLLQEMWNSNYKDNPTKKIFDQYI